MKAHRRQTFYFWSGLVLIALLYSAYYIFFLYDASLTMPLRARHVVKFFFILGVYGVGLLGLARYAAGWVVRSWHFCYLFGLFLLILLGGYDWMVARAPLSIREVADDVQEFLVSPILYVALGLLSRWVTG